MSKKENDKFDEYKKLIDEALEFPELSGLPLGDAMMYSVSAGGKRIRPVLTIAFCDAYGGDIKKALPAATAIELIHTFTLIHDDLPCMDDDDLRRGKPSCHKAFSEADAVLAGDALIFYAYELMAKASMPAAAFLELSVLSGIKGVIGGQKLDLLYENVKASAEETLKMYGMKTCALLQACCKIGCISANAGQKAVQNASDFAYKLGLAFQLVDDILDFTSDEKTLGKPINSDQKNGKRTYVSAVGLDKAKKDAKRFTDEALELLKNVPDNEFLTEITKKLLERKK